ncbi:MAG: protein Im not dead yet [Bacteroidota bacterium]|jgi:sodium-dependent dicarboxylate transporter 2/3/5|nr:protein Im not dead yet [Bacteroidota bacterium]
MDRNLTKYLFIALGPLVAICMWTFTELDPSNPKVSHMAGIALWMSIWWFTEAVGLAVTALVPFLVMPLLGLADTKSVAQQYTDSIIFLFIGGFMLAFAIEKWNLHKRIAIKILSVVGTRPHNILLGVMLSSYLISNWISNTATTMMLFGAVLALISETDEFIHNSKSKNHFAAAILLGLAFSATIGGMATPVGTPPNMYFFKAYKEAFPSLNDLTFLKWATIGFPLSAVFLICTFLVLRFYFLRNKVIITNLDKNHFKRHYGTLGRFSYEEKWIASIFIACMLLWFTRADLPFETFTFRGWNHIFSNPKLVDDATVAIAAALLLFLIPSKQNKGEALLEWEDAKKIRYDIILMFGSGFALAYGFDVSGLSEWLAHCLAALKGIPLFFIILGICLIVTLISEFASNIASIQLAIPVMVALQKDLDLPPLLLMIPATFAASLGFMLPVATAANTIVFGTKRIDIKDMFRVGIVLDVIGIILITVFCFLILG